MLRPMPFSFFAVCSSCCLNMYTYQKRRKFVLIAQWTSAYEISRTFLHFFLKQKRPYSYSPWTCPSSMPILQVLTSQPPKFGLFCGAFPIVDFSVPPQGSLRWFMVLHANQNKVYYEGLWYWMLTKTRTAHESSTLKFFGCMSEPFGVAETHYKHGGSPFWFIAVSVFKWIEYRPNIVVTISVHHRLGPWLFCPFVHFVPSCPCG